MMKKIKINYVLTKVKKFQDGDKVGKAEIYIKDKKVAIKDIFIEVKKETKLSWWQRIIGWFKKW